MVTIAAAMYCTCLVSLFLYLLRLLRGRGLWPDNLYFALSDRATHSEIECDMSVAYPGILFGGGSTNSVEDRGQRERGSGGGSPLVRGSGGSCILIQEISYSKIFLIFGTLRLFMMTTDLFFIVNVKQLRTGGSFRILLPFFRASWGVGILNSAIFNNFHSRVEFGTVLVGLRNFGGGGVEPPSPPTLVTPLWHVHSRPSLKGKVVSPDLRLFALRTVLKMCVCERERETFVGTKTTVNHATVTACVTQARPLRGTWRWVPSCAWLWLHPTT